MKATVSLCALAVAPSGIQWMSLGNHNYLRVAVHYIDEQWELCLHALTAAKTEESGKE